MVRTNNVEAEETRQFFEISRELRDLRRLQPGRRLQHKSELLEEIEAIFMHTQQPTLALQCRRLLAEFEYVRRTLNIQATINYAASGTRD